MRMLVVVTILIFRFINIYVQDNTETIWSRTTGRERERVREVRTMEIVQQFKRDVGDNEETQRTLSSSRDREL